MFENFVKLFGRFARIFFASLGTLSTKRESENS